MASNERLEFLGDAVLGLTVCRWLYEDYPEYSEGDLTKIKSAVVSRRSCGRVACVLGLDRCLIVGRGVTRNRSFPRSLVSDVFEAVVAALYLDAGDEMVKQRLKLWLADEVRHAVETQGASNFKSSLQQYAQRTRQHPGVSSDPRIRAGPSQVVLDRRRHSRASVRCGLGRQQKGRRTTCGVQCTCRITSPSDPVSERRGDFQLIDLVRSEASRQRKRNGRAGAT